MSESRYRNALVVTGSVLSAAVGILIWLKYGFEEGFAVFVLLQFLVDIRGELMR